MTLTDSQRAATADLTWFDPPSPFETASGLPMRPLSLATWKALEIMGLPYLDDAAELTLVQEQQMMEVYLWLHTDAIHVISDAMHTRAWRAWIERSYEPDPEELALFRVHRARSILSVTAVMVKPIPRSGVKADKTPRHVCEPSNYTMFIGTLLADYEIPRGELLWQLPLPQAFALYHRSLRTRGIWTVLPGREVKDDDFTDTDFTPRDLGALDMRAEGDTSAH